MLNDTTVKSRLIGAAMSLAKVRPWRELTLDGHRRGGRG